MNSQFRSASLYTCIFAFAVLLSAWRAHASPPPGYYLVWNDEFNGTSLDPTKWWTWYGPSESAFNVPDTVTLTNGYLTITTYTTNGTNFSAIISSDARFRALYGYYESSIEFSDTSGEWSAFWIQSPTEGEFIGDPSESGAEMDICEHRYSDANNVDVISNQVQTSVHWDGYSTSEQTATTGQIGSGLGTNFHTYGMLWDHTNYTFSIDGSQIWVTNAGHSDRTEVIMFSQEVHSNGWAGIVPTGGYGNALASTTKMVVDYVRYYAPTTTVFWTGTSSANWADSGNWLSNMVPNASNDVIFGYLSLANYSVSLAQNTAINSVSIQEASPVTISGSPLTIGSGGIDMLSAINNAIIASPVVVGSNQAWRIGSGYVLTVTGPVSGTGNVAFGGRGAVVLAASNTCSGTMSVTNGLLYVNGLVRNPITVQGGILTGTGVIAGAVQVNSGGTVTGNTVFTGPVQVNAVGTLSPGQGLGTMTISNSLTLGAGSVLAVDVNKTAGTSDLITGLTGVTYGGTLVVNNQSGTFATRDAFKLFNAQNYSGTFGRILPLTPGTNLAWDTSTLAIDGTLRVTTTLRANIAAVHTGGQVTLSWPSNNLGWYLQCQSNVSFGVGVGSNWTTIAGSSLTNVMTINPSVGSVFYRLVSPSFTTAQFAKGDLIVLQVGNGSIGSSGAPGFLNDYMTIGGPMQTQYALPTNGANALVFGGSSYDGAITLSADGQSIVIPGYNVAVGGSSSAVDSSSTTGASAVLRAVGTVNEAGTFTLAATTTKFSGSTIRSAISDGAGNYWAGGGASGVVYLGNTSASSTLWSSSTATRTMNLLNENIYFTETGSGIGMMGFTGAPKSAATPVLLANTSGTGTGTASPEGFAVNAAKTIAYVADNRTAANGGGVQRFNWSGSAWVYAYTLGYSASSSKEIYFMIADFSGANPVIYATTGEASANNLVTVTDTGAGSTFTILETAPSGDAFRGLAFAP